MYGRELFFVNIKLTDVVEIFLRDLSQSQYNGNRCKNCLKNKVLLYDYLLLG